METNLPVDHRRLGERGQVTKIQPLLASQPAVQKGRNIMREFNERNPCEDRGCDCCLHFREEWTPGSIYRPGEAVPYDGSSYVAIHWNQNDPPPSGNWAQISSKGDAGPAGAPGAPGATGPAGPQGPPGDSTGSAIYTNSRLTDSDGVGFVPEGVDITTLSVDQGCYVVMATVLMQNVDGDDQNWTIELRQADTVLCTARGRASSGQFDSGVVIAPFSNNADGFVRLTLRGYGYNIVVSPTLLQPFSFVAMRGTGPLLGTA